MCLPLPPDPPMPPTLAPPLGRDGFEDCLKRSLASGNGDQGNRVRPGHPVLTWRRPPLSQLERRRPILATGQYATAYTPEHGIPVPDSNRGFPQPPIEDGFTVEEADEESGE